MGIKRTTLLIFFFILIFSTHAYSQDVWKITSLNWEPYSGAELANQGNSVQKLKNLLAKNNIKLVVEFYPWKRAQKLAQTSDYVGYFPAWPEEVQNGFVASPPIDWSEISVLIRGDKNITFQSIDSLFKNNKVGIIKTYVYPKEINNAMLKYPNNVDETPNELLLVRKLFKARNNVAITDPNVMLYIADKEGIDNIVELKNIMKKELVISFRDGVDNKKNIELMKEILK